jgi:hypothetical protein
MVSKDYFAQMRFRLSPTLLKVIFLLINLTIVAAKFQPLLPTSERWG